MGPWPFTSITSHIGRRAMTLTSKSIALIRASIWAFMLTLFVDMLSRPDIAFSSCQQPRCHRLAWHDLLLDVPLLSVPLGIDVGDSRPQACYVVPAYFGTALCIRILSWWIAMTQIFHCTSTPRSFHLIFSEPFMSIFSMMDSFLQVGCRTASRDVHLSLSPAYGLSPPWLRLC
jgi:hypothetical protein